MGLFTSTELNSMDDLLVDQLRDLYDAEHRIADALPKMSNAATSKELKSAFDEHLNETKEQIVRLDKAFKLLDQESKRKTCEATKGLLKEGEEIIEAKGDNAVKDAALIAAAQRVEHYEMAGYGAARNFAQRCNRQDVADLLQTTLNEEGKADETLTSLAKESINLVASKA